MSKPTFNPTISISRAGYVGHWQDFVAENAAFIPDHELTKIELSLKHAGTATHTAASAGDFVFEIAK